MAEELGKIEKPPAENYRLGRKLLFVPLLYAGEGFPKDYVKKTNAYWEQVLQQVKDITSRLGSVKHIFHELIAESGTAGAEAIKQLNPGGYSVIETALSQGASVAPLEDAGNLTEFMDWGRCLYIGLQNPDVEKKVVEFYNTASEARKKHLAEVIDTTLRQDEMGLLIMREGHQVSFPSDIQVFYVAPPALDEIKRWLREQESAAEKDGDAS
jgi:hypothetical protein